MRDIERQFPQHAAGVTIGLYNAVLTDIDVLLLFVAGILLGLETRKSRAMGKVLLTYVIFRRTDAYVGVVGSNLAKIGKVMADKELREAATHE